jgi:putative heme transporter
VPGYRASVPTEDSGSIHLVRGRPLVRYVLGVALGALILVILLGRRGELAGATTRLAHLDWPWAIGAALAEALSLCAYAAVQRVVLVAAGTRVALGPLFAITLANNSIALTIPGEPVFSSAFRYRQYRRRGATAAAAGWTIVTLIIAQAIGLSLIIFVALVVSLTGGARGPSAGVGVVALVVVALAGALFLRRDLLVGVLRGAVRASRRVTGHPRGDLLGRVERVMDDVAAIRVSGPRRLGVVALALGAWLADCACLVASLRSVHAGVPGHGILLAYGAAQVVAVLPVVPGGLGVVEGSLTVILVAYGVTRVPAIAGVLVYRIINFWLAVGVGWIAFAGVTVRARPAAPSTSRARRPVSREDP